MKESLSVESKSLLVEKHEEEVQQLLIGINKMNEGNLQKKDELETLNKELEDVKEMLKFKEEDICQLK